MKALQKMMAKPLASQYLLLASYASALGFCCSQAQPSSHHEGVAEDDEQAVVNTCSTAGIDLLPVIFGTRLLEASWRCCIPVPSVDADLIIF
ncbi:hypothetical protein FKW77_009272 [Venturia effusa]|uniref:Secreted protein n=1 Tax=Venturia effusa TaxID=50376 RepID=A0A517LCX4_9PEZI|nr:hypothetical protein FKW77_009272 [Venturia effusa]